MVNVEIDREYTNLREALIKELSGSCKLAVIQAPPGSGKTHMLLAVVSSLVREGKRVSLAAQTRRQAGHAVSVPVQQMVFRRAV